MWYIPNRRNTFTLKPLFLYSITVRIKKRPKKKEKKGEKEPVLFLKKNFLYCRNLSSLTCKNIFLLKPKASLCWTLNVAVVSHDLFCESVRLLIFRFVHQDLTWKRHQFDVIFIKGGHWELNGHIQDMIWREEKKKGELSCFSKSLLSSIPPVSPVMAANKK